MLSIIAALSISVNLLFLWKHCHQKQRKPKTTKYRKAKRRENGRTFVFPHSAHSSLTSSDSEEMELTLLKSRRRMAS